MFYFALFGCRNFQLWFDQIIQNRSDKTKEKGIQIVNFDLLINQTICDVPRENRDWIYLPIIYPI